MVSEHVGEDGDAHADVAAHNRGDGADDKGDAGKPAVLPLPLAVLLVAPSDQHAHRRERENDEDPAELVLGPQKGVGAGGDGGVQLEKAGVLLGDVGAVDGLGAHERLVVGGNVEGDARDELEEEDRKRDADEARHDDQRRSSLRRVGGRDVAVDAGKVVHESTCGCKRVSRCLAGATKPPPGAAFFISWTKVKDKKNACSGPVLMEVRQK